MPDPMIAYCGPAPVPNDIWMRWNFDPLLMATLAALTLVIARGRSSDARAGWAAIALMVVIFDGEYWAPIFCARAFTGRNRICLTPGRRRRFAGYAMT